MPKKRSMPFGIAMLAVGLAMLVTVWGGAWGTAYGQSAGPTPTPGSNTSPLTAVKTVAPSSGAPGEALTFTITLQNTETTVQRDIRLTDNLVDFLEPVSVSVAPSSLGSGSINGQTVSAVIPELQPGATATVTIVARIRNGTGPTTGVNVADVTYGNDGGSSTTTTTNPVAIGISTPPPSSLPDTGAFGGATALWTVLGVALSLGGLFLLGRGRRAQTQR